MEPGRAHTMQQPTPPACHPRRRAAPLVPWQRLLLRCTLPQGDAPTRRPPSQLNNGRRPPPLRPHAPPAQPKDGGPWTDLLTLVHINGTKPPRAGTGAGDLPRAGSRAEKAAADKEAARERERGAWGSGGPTIPDVATALVAYSSSLEELDVRSAGVGGTG